MVGTLFVCASCGGGGGGGDEGTEIITSDGASYRVELVTSGLAFPVSLAFSPDGRLFIAELASGAIRVLQNGAVLAEPLAVLPALGTGGEGPLGLTLDPDFPINRFIYVYQTEPEPFRNRVLRYRVEGNTAEDLPVVLLDNIPAGGHNGGKLVFGADGFLYISTGDAGDPSRAQDLGNLGGKILRINRDGEIPADNPFGDSPVYAFGFRNVFGLASYPSSGIIFASDNGPDCDDEINRVGSGENYGWRPSQPCGESEGDFVSPIVRLNPSIGVTGVTVYSGGVFPEFSGNLFVTDYNTGTLRRYVIADQGAGVITEEAALFSGNYGPIIDVTTGPDGNLYFANQDSVFRVVRGE